jgi:xylan 1,4-beta-xylosidase
VESDRLLTIGTAKQFKVLDKGEGQVAFESAQGLVSVPTSDGKKPLILKKGRPSASETFRWIETPQGELTLLSLMTHRHLHLTSDISVVLADSPGPQRKQVDGSRLRWKLAGV